MSKLTNTYNLQSIHLLYQNITTLKIQKSKGIFINHSQN